MGTAKDILSSYSNKNTLRLHMPGHKGRINPLDLTEIPQTDDFNSPEGGYLPSFELIKKAYKSNRSFFITSGATVGIQAAMLYAIKMGYKVLALRNSHLSILNACFIFGAKCEILDGTYDSAANTYLSPEEEIIKYLESAEDKCAVFLTSPDYFGRCLDIANVKKAASKSDSLIICDEAHGAHFVFSSNLPESAGEFADIWINGAHKTLGALTPGAFVHVAESIDENIFGAIFKAVNTTSPSHVIAASLEDAVLNAQTGVWDERAEQCAALEKKINALDNIKCADIKWAKIAGFSDKDVTRIVLDAKNTGGGFLLIKKLFMQYNIQLEMADFRYAVAIMTVYDDENTDDILFSALRELDNKQTYETLAYLPQIAQKALPAQNAWMNNAQYVTPEKAEGRISAGILGAYPPGTALILPGEIITREHIEYLNKITERGGHVFGKENGMIAVCDI